MYILALIETSNPLWSMEFLEEMDYVAGVSKIRAIDLGSTIAGECIPIEKIEVQAIRLLDDESII